MLIDSYDTHFWNDGQGKEMEGMTMAGCRVNWYVERKYHSHHCMLNTLHPAGWQSTAAQSLYAWHIPIPCVNRVKMAEMIGRSSSSTFPGLVIANVLFIDTRLGRGADVTVYEVDWNGTRCAAKRLHEILLEDQSAGGVAKLMRCL